MYLIIFEDANDWLKAKNLDFLKEDKEMAHIWLIACKEKIKKYFDKWVRLKDFHEGNLVLKRAGGPRTKVRERKMVANWEGLYRIIGRLLNEAYQLESINGEKLLEI